MSADLIPAHLANQLRKLADQDCPVCLGEGHLSFTARNRHGYTEVRCHCVDKEPHATSPRSVCGCGGGWTFDFQAGRVYCRDCEQAGA